MASGMTNPLAADASEGANAMRIASSRIQRGFNPERDMIDYRMQPLNPAVPRAGKQSAHKLAVRMCSPLCTGFIALLQGTGLLISLPYWMLGKRRRQKYREGLRERLGKVPSRLRERG